MLRMIRTSDVVHARMITVGDDRTAPDPPTRLHRDDYVHGAGHNTSQNFPL
jgi:hypothetical protein